jgi:hypothetical protein
MKVTDFWYLCGQNKGKYTNKTTKGAKESILRFLRSCTLIGVDIFVLIA